MQREEREQLTLGALQLALAADQMEPRLPEQRVHLHPRVRLRSQDERHAEQLVEPPARTAHDQQATRAELERRVQGELEVAGVLLSRIPPDRDALPLQLLDDLRRERVQVADDQLEIQTESARLSGPAVGSNHLRMWRDSLESPGRSAVRDDDNCVRHHRNLP